MLELRPSCEHCDKPLGPDSSEAMICSFECTFCRDCVSAVLLDVCPNCGGGFAPRPIRPAHNHHGDNYLGAYPPSETRRHRPVDARAHAHFAAGLRDIPPQRR
jgi:hypothetical protein